MEKQAEGFIRSTEIGKQLLLQGLSGDFQRACGKMLAQICAISIFLFLKFYNFIKGTVHIHSILKNLRPVFSYFTY